MTHPTNRLPMGLLSAPQAAAYLGIANATLHRAVKRGIIAPALKTPGGNLRFTLAELDRYIAESLGHCIPNT